jgi:hypothetical protein
MAKENNDFIEASQVIAIHIERYNRQIDRLLAVLNYSIDDVHNKLVDRREYYKARERKIKAYMDALQTLSQKEKLLQFHNTGFQIEIIEEKIVVNQYHSKYDLSKLNFDEQLRLYNLMKIAKRTAIEISSIKLSTKEDEQQQQVTDIEYDEVPNIEKIQKEELPAPSQTGGVTAADPTSRLRQELKKMAARNFKEAGAILTEDEEKFIENDSR